MPRKLPCLMVGRSGWLASPWQAGFIPPLRWVFKLFFEFCMNCILSGHAQVHLPAPRRRVDRDPHNRYDSWVSSIVLWSNSFPGLVINQPIFVISAIAHSWFCLSFDPCALASSTTWIGSCGLSSRSVILIPFRCRFSLIICLYFGLSILNSYTLLTFVSGDFIW